MIIENILSHHDFYILFIGLTVYYHCFEYFSAIYFMKCVDNTNVWSGVQILEAPLDGFEGPRDKTNVSFL